MTDIKIHSDINCPKDKVFFIYPPKINFLWEEARQFEEEMCKMIVLSPKMMGVIENIEE